MIIYLKAHDKPLELIEIKNEDCTTSHAGKYRRPGEFSKRTKKRN